MCLPVAALVLVLTCSAGLRRLCPEQLNIYGSSLCFAEEDIKPSYYKLTNPETNLTACLAAGFSRQNATKQSDMKYFQNQPAVQISNSGLFNQVALIKDNDKCDSGKKHDSPNN